MDERMSLLVLLLYLSVPVFSHPCYSPDSACQIDENNFLGSLDEIPDIAECRQICQDTELCQYFTYYNDQEVPSYYQKCYLFSDCAISINIPLAYTGVTGPCTCSMSEVEPLDGEMGRDMFAETEIECKDACIQEVGCETYTYLDSGNDCKLYGGVSSYGKSTIPDLKTGPARCTSDDEICTFSLIEYTNHIMLQESVRPIIVRSAMKDCMVKISIVLVGRGGMASRWNAAGGSGFVNHTVTTIRPWPFSILEVYFDDLGGQVTVFANGNHVILEAQPGQEGIWGHKGGDGYSGGGYGGGNEGMDGGTDGGDGECDTSEPETCGKGMGIDIRQLSTAHYVLTPGPGGGTNGTNAAGGGGGVLVNGEGTPMVDVSFGMGEGYANKAGWGFAIMEIVQ